MNPRPACTLLLLCFMPLMVWADDTVDFSAQIRPLLSKNCFSCHGPDEKSRQARMRLDLRADAIKGRRKGDHAIKPGDPEGSLLLARVRSNDPAFMMPPPESGHALKPEEVELLRRWIKDGAVYSPHWAFVKPVRPGVPQVKAGWVRNPIDHFILAKMETHRLQPSPEADRHTLARRVSLDLTGLPPAPKRVDAFVNDPSPNAYEKFVDELLASPAYGERWARVWLDLARYADSAGYGSDPLRLNIWPYRDWVISAYNRNLPYDQFTREQLAGDLLSNPTKDQLTATAFHRNTMTNTEGGTIDEEWRVAAVKDRNATTFQVWMGLTMGCAQCHSHKFDPISHKEFYQSYALFNQTEDSDREDEYPTLPLPTEREVKRKAEFEQRIAGLQKEIPLSRARLAALTGLMPRNLAGVVSLSLQTKLAAETPRQLAAARRDLAGIKPVAVPMLRELTAGKLRKSHILHKGNYLDPGQEVGPGVPAEFGPWPKGLPMNRLGLSAWLFSPENPLTARVAVNRLWAQLFGTGLVETEEDFGTQGQLPSHRELLDWLAVEFREQGWDQKKMLKLIVMSATYRQSSRVTPELLKVDPRGRLLSRYPRQRLDAEQIRDQALALSGLLSKKIGGPSVYPPQPDGLWRAAFNGQRTYPTSTGEDRYRRGLYTIWRRTVPYPSMATFDAPSRETCTVKRIPTNTPLHAYVTLNDPVFVEASQALGRRILKEGGPDPTSRIRYGLRLALGRPAEERNVQALLHLYEESLTRFRKTPAEAKKLATPPVSSLPKEMDVAEAAAWTVVGNVLLNLDGVLMKG
jgi:hypothetical protein